MTIVKARQANGGEAVRLPDGRLDIAEAGDWIVSDAVRRIVVPAALFPHMFEIAEKETQA